MQDSAGEIIDLAVTPVIGTLCPTREMSPFKVRIALRLRNDVINRQARSGKLLSTSVSRTSGVTFDDGRASWNPYQARSVPMLNQPPAACCAMPREGRHDPGVPRGSPTSGK